MIDILGIKRILVLTLVIAINGILAFFVYANLVPQYEKQERELRSIQGQISTTGQRLDQILTEFDQIEQQKIRFDALKDRGLFDSQNRIKAQDLLESILFQSKVTSAKATIGGGKSAPHPSVAESGYNVLTSPISIEIQALNDIDVYKYLWLLEKQFKGYIDVKEFTLNRQGNVTREVLQSIISGQNPTIVSAKIKVDWITLIKTDQQQGRGL